VANCFSNVATQNVDDWPPCVNVQQLLFVGSLAQSCAFWQSRTLSVPGHVNEMFVVHVAVQLVTMLWKGQFGGVPAPTVIVPQQ
jgi:hypothetical protein